MARVTQEQYDEFPWQPVESSNIGRVAYTPTGHDQIDAEIEIGNLYIEFARDERTRAYSYENVPSALWQDLLKAASIGSFFANNIRGRYVHERIEVEDD